MPSPFPGMDPYLEASEVFPDLHDRLCTHLSEAIQLHLPPPYYAVINRRVWLEISSRPIEPDIHVRHAGTPTRRPGVASGGVAVLERPTSRAIVVRVVREERRQNFLEIYAGRGTEKRLVTTIEVLSPTNKTPGEGRDQYLRKQREALESQVHLIEIDLLRAGEHTTAVPRYRVEEDAGPFDYHVCVHRFDNLEDYFVYPIKLEETLPPVEVPLLPDDGSVEVDLQAVLTRCYDAGPYHREIDYLHDAPVPPLTPEQAEWAHGLIQARGAGA